MRQLYRSTVALSAAAGIVLSLAVTATASTGGAPGPGSSTVGVAPIVPIGAHATGAAPANERVGFDVVLRPRNQGALDAFVASVSTPGSADYHQFLTPAEFASQFGPTASTMAAVSATLQALGLTVGTPTGSVLPVSGSVSTVGGAFKTSFRRYQLASGRVARANVAAPQLPNSVVNAVQGVVGLDDLAQFSHPVPTLHAAAPSPAISANLTGPTACVAVASAGGYTAGQLASYYGLTASYAAGTRGAGITVALVELEPFTPSDIATYKTCYGTTTTVTTTNIDGGPSGAQSGEAALDIEDVIGLAPDAAVRVYQGPNANVATDINVFDVFNAIANDSSLAQVVSTSWGQCEASASSSFIDSENAVFERMAAQGQTVFAASGDAGSADCDNSPGTTSTALAVDDPASQPFVTGAGGTDLATAGGPEVTWNDGIVNSGTQVSAGGGGVSSNWQMPSWQTALGTITGSSAAPCGAPAGALCREVPDVSASSRPNHGYPIFVNGHWNVYGGTSAAAPTWAALIALIDASCGGGNKLGFINPALYQLRAAGTSDFHDITSGNNDGAGANSGTYAAATGYDMATGLGSPVGAALRTDLCPPTAADGSGTMTVNHATVGAGTRTTPQFTYTVPAGQGMTNGEMTLAIPTGWSAPSTSTSTAGYATSSAGTVVITGGVIDVKGVTTVAGGTVVITYGDTSGGAPGALAPSSARTSVFSASQRATAAGTLTALSSSPQVLVGTAPDGSGTVAVSPSGVAVTTPTTLTFTYTPPAGAGLVAGAVAITVPSGWTAPQIGSNSAAGFVTTSAGTVAISGGTTILVDPVTIAIGGMLAITYGNTAGSHPVAAAVPPASATTSTFSGQQRGTAGGGLTSLASSPTVTVGGGGSGAGGGGSSGGSGGGAAVPSQLVLLRVSGADRVGTSVAASQTAFPAANTAQAVVLARSDGFADALAGTPLAVGKHGPLLLTGSGALSTATRAEILRVLAPGGTVYLLGGTSALSPAVASAVTALGHPVVRVSGTDRFATAVQVAGQLGNPTIAFEADGTTFADALSAGAAAAASGGAILLTAGPSQSSATAAYLAAHPGATRYAIGGPAAAADHGATPYVGSDRFATSVLVAQAFFTAPQSIGFASGITFPDALSGGSVTAMNHGPVLLVPTVGPLPASLSTYLATAKESAAAAWLFGGTSSVTAQVFGEVASALATAP